jgi:hypothetical protein
MGEDSFSGWFTSDSFCSEQQRASAYRKALGCAYALGVRGFSISPHQTLMRELAQFKSVHKDIVCIANHHWQSHYYMGDNSLWAKENILKLAATILQKTSHLSVENCHWFENLQGATAFNEKEIASIYLKEAEYRSSLALFADWCDFALVGNLVFGALVFLEKTGIIEREIEILSKSGLSPLGMCEGGGPLLTVFERLPVDGMWLWFNKHFSFPNVTSVLKETKYIKKPLTAYKIFSDGHTFDLDGSIDFLKGTGKFAAMVIGVDDHTQAFTTFSRLRTRDGNNKDHDRTAKASA